MSARAPPPMPSPRPHNSGRAALIKLGGSCCRVQCTFLGREPSRCAPEPPASLLARARTAPTPPIPARTRARPHVRLTHQRAPRPEAAELLAPSPQPALSPAHPHTQTYHDTMVHSHRRALSFSFFFFFFFFSFFLRALPKPHRLAAARSARARAARARIRLPESPHLLAMRPTLSAPESRRGARETGVACFRFRSARARVACCRARRGGGGGDEGRGEG